MALKGTPLWFNGAEISIKVFPTDARQFCAWCGRNCGVGLWRCRPLVRVVDDGRNGYKWWSLV